MPKVLRLNHVVATVAGKKTAAEKALTEVYHIAQKNELFAGLVREYTPKFDGGDAKPSEKKMPQYRVSDLYRKVEGALVAMFDEVGTVDYTNCGARADVVVDGKTLMVQAPVTYLLFMEKQVTNLKNFVEKLPVRDANEEWGYQQEAALFATPPATSLVSAKVQEPIVLHPATVEHPAQTQLITKDVTVGTWSSRKFSGAITRQDQEKMLDRLNKLSDAVKVAREEANNVEAKPQQIGGLVLDFVFAGVLK